MTKENSRSALDPRDHFFDVRNLSTTVAKRSGKNGTFTIFISIVKVFFLLFTTAVLARLIPPNEFSVVALTMPVLLIATSLSQMGLTQAVAQKSEVDHKLASDLFWFGATVGFVLSCLMGPIGHFAAIFFSDDRLRLVFPSLGLAVFAGTVTGQFLALYWRRMQVRQAEVINVISIAISASAGVISALLGASYWAVVIQQVSLPIVNALLLCVWMGWLPSRPRPIDWGATRNSLSFGGYLALSSTLLQVSQILGTLFAGRVFVDNVAAIYYRAWNLSRMPVNMLVLPLGSTFIPAFSRLNEAPDEMRALFRRMVSRLTFPLAPVGVTFFIAAPETVGLVLGPSWTLAAPILAVFSLKIMLSAFISSFYWAIIASGKSGQLAVIAVMHVVLVAVMLFVSYPYGLLTMSMAGVGADLFTQLLVCGLMVVYFTQIEWHDIQSLALETSLYVGALLVVGFVVLKILSDAGEVMRLAGLFAGMLCVVAGRLVVQPSLRNDVFKAMPNSLTRFGKKV